MYPRRCFFRSRALAIYLALCIHPFAVIADFGWIQHINGPGWQGEPILASDPEGNALLSFIFQDKVSFANTNFTSTGQDTILAKFAPTGNLLWALHAKGPSWQAGRALAVDKNGNSYWAGMFETNIQLSATHSLNREGYSGFVTKVSANGEVQWLTEPVCPAYGIRTMTADGNNTFVVFSINGTVQVGTNWISSTNQYTDLVVKLDQSGKVIWAQTASGPTSFGIIDVALTTDGSVIIAGVFTKEANFGNTLFFGPDKGMFVAKISPGGSPLWIKVGGEVTQTYGTAASCLQVDNEDNIYVGIQAQNNISIDGQVLVVGGQQPGLSALILKLDTSGKIQWSYSPAGNIGLGTLTLTQGGLLAMGGGISSPFWLGSSFISQNGIILLIDRTGKAAAGFGLPFGGSPKSLSGLANGALGVSGSFREQITLGNRILRASSQSDDDVFLAEVYPPPVITKLPSLVEAPPGGELRIKVEASGNSPLQFQWFTPSSPIPGATNAELNVTAVTPDDFTYYRVQIRDAYGMVESWPVKAFVRVDTDRDGISDLLEKGDDRYEPVTGAFTLEEAREDATRRGGHLATIVSQAEFQQITNKYFAWEFLLGGFRKDTASSWTWDNLEPFAFSNFQAGGDVPGSLILRNNKFVSSPSHVRHSYLLERGFPTNERLPDTDGDSISDYDEIYVTKTFPNFADSDADGIPDGTELDRKTNPLQSDSDRDGVTDPDELFVYFTDPLLNDSDSDGLDDGREINLHHTDPLKADTDNDGFSDGVEVRAGKDPNDAQNNPGTNLNIYPAVELEFFPLAGIRYQLQVSIDLRTWTNVGSPIQGEGQPWTTFQSARGSTASFYRIEIVP